MKVTLSFAAAATAALLAVPAFAQTPPAAAQPNTTPQGRPMMRDGQQGQHPRMHGMFANMSPEGRKLMINSMRSTHDAPQQAQLKAARDRVNQLVAADRLDAAALTRAMDDERRLVDGQHVRRQQALVAALQKLSPEDRKAFAAASQMGRERMAEMMKQRNDRRGQRPMPQQPGN